MPDFLFDQGKNKIEGSPKIKIDQIDNEIINVRQSVDGRIYPDAGDAVRGQISSIASLEVGKNLIDMSKNTIGFLLNNGNISTEQAYANYATSEFIGVEEDENFVFNVFSSSANKLTTRKIVLFYNSNFEPITSSYKNGVYSDLLITAPENAKYLRVCSLLNITNLFQLEAGTTGTAYEQYTIISTLNPKTELSQKMIEQIDSIIDDILPIKNFKTIINGNDIKLSSFLGSYVLEQNLSFGKRLNKLFEFENTNLYINNVSKRIHNRPDDITPLRLSANNSLWTIGANHGWDGFEISKGNLTTVDIGSIWTDGTNNFILANVGDEKANFIYPSTFVDHQYIYTKALPAANLQHVSGATHTSNLNIEGVKTAQLYPSINNKTIKFYCDNVEVVEGTFDCDNFTVIETYNIIDYADMGTYLIDNVGVGITDEIDGCVKVTNVYSFSNNFCLITTTYEALKAVEFYNCGFIQTLIMPVTGTEKRYLYVNNMNNDSDVKSSVLYDAPNDTSQLYLYGENFINSNYAVNRFINLICDSNNNKLYGFSMGYFPDISDTRDENRKLINFQGEFRSGTLKNYPVGIYRVVANVGQVFTCCAYNNYYLPEEFTNCSIIKANNATYIIIDIHKTVINKTVELPAEYIGKTIEVLESYNFELKNEVVGGNGVVFDTVSNYGCAILKI
ncbi:MAG: hypothetical protein IK122_02710 [Alphaproteobacteria bacterium]|nr:hypothetical protein [Alphaproteobacteria bacterium]